MSLNPDIENKNTILTEVDEKLKQKNPPALEYLLFQPFIRVKLPFGYGICFNPFGHASVRYTLPSGEQYVMNIEAEDPKNKNMVQFRKPEEFIFNDDPEKAGSQGGIFNREIVGLRVENLPDENILAMHEYFKYVQKCADDGECKFWIMPPIFRNKLTTYGNCSYYTSKGLQKAGVVTNHTYYPKSVFIHMFENATKTDAKSNNNVNVVVYKKKEGSKLMYGKDGEPIKWVAPFDSVRSWVYYDLKRFANATVDYKDDVAKVNINPNPDQPSDFRNTANSKWMIGLSVLVTGIGLKRASGRIANFTYSQMNRWRNFRMNTTRKVKEKFKKDL